MSANTDDIEDLAVAEPISSQFSTHLHNIPVSRERHNSCDYLDSGQMADLITNESWEEKEMAEGESTGSSVVWAFALIIIVAIIAGVFFYSGGFPGSQKKDIDVEIKAPTR